MRSLALQYCCFCAALFADTEIQAQGSQETQATQGVPYAANQADNEDLASFAAGLDGVTDADIEAGYATGFGINNTEFTWLRGQYTNHLSGAGFTFRRNGGWWDTDYPDSDENFLRGVMRYTHVDTSPDNHQNLSLTDPRLFEHIFLYMNWKRVPIGTSFSGPNFTEEETEALREFMLRGGFVMVDDFWGQPHLDDMFMEIGKIFPDREIVRLDTGHEIFHIFFDIDELAQVPGRMVTWDFGGYMKLDDPEYPPEVYGVLDDDGRIMLVANYNTDLGDGWEHTFYEGYPTKYTNEAYRIGINFLIYAFSH